MGRKYRLMFDVPPIANLLAPGLWQGLNGRSRRGFTWLVAIVATSPLVLPAIILWALCLAEAFRLEAADRAAGRLTPPPLPPL